MQKYIVNVLASVSGVIERALKLTWKCPDVNDLPGNTSLDSAFNEITQLIVTARQRAMQAVNTELIELHWQVGAYISRKIEAAEWGGWSRRPVGHAP